MQAEVPATQRTEEDMGTTMGGDGSLLADTAAYYGDVLSRSSSDSMFR